MRRNECLECRFRNKTWLTDPCRKSPQSPYFEGSTKWSTRPYLFKKPPTWWQRTLWWLTDHYWRASVMDERALMDKKMEDFTEG